MKAMTLMTTAEMGLDAVRQANSLYESGEREQGLDDLFTLIDDLLCAGRFDRCDKILAAAPFEKLNSSILLGLLQTTLAAKWRLANRAGLYRHLCEQLQRAGLNPAIAEGLK